MALNYERSGSGEPLLLIHGIGHSLNAWRPVVERLQRERDVIVVDLPGFGESPPLTDGIEPDAGALTDAVAELLGELRIERPAVGGNSLGGLVALELAKRGRARAVVAISPAGFWSNRFESVTSRAQLIGSRRVAVRVKPLVTAAMRTRAGRIAALAGMHGHPSRVPPDEAIGEVEGLAAATGFERTLQAIHGRRFEGPVPADVPVTIVWGTRDRLLLPRQAKVALDVIPHARLVRLPGGGHLPMWDEPNAIARELLAA